MSRYSLYDQRSHIVVLDGIALSKFGEGDFAEVTLNGTYVQRTQGADGCSSNFCPQAGGTVLLNLSPISPQLDDLYEIRNQQAIRPRLFTMALLTGVNEIFTAFGCGFGEQPSFITGGSTMQPRQFLIEFQRYQMEHGAGEIGGGLLGGLVNF